MADGNIAAHADSESKFYVYILRRPDKLGGDGLPEAFYVGCGLAVKGGRPQRIDQHERDARQGFKAYRFSIIRKLWASGYAVHKSVDSWHSTKASMFARERELIERYGRQDLETGPLANRTAGGDGAFEPGPATRAAMKAGQLAIRDQKVALGKKHAARTIPGAVEARSKRWASDPEFQQVAIMNMLAGQETSRSAKVEFWIDLNAKKSTKMKQWIDDNREAFMADRARGGLSYREWARRNPLVVAENVARMKAAANEFFANNPDVLAASVKKAAGVAGVKRHADAQLRPPIKARCRELIKVNGLEVVEPSFAAWSKTWLEFEKKLLGMVDAIGQVKAGGRSWPQESRGVGL